MRITSADAYRDLLRFGHCSGEDTSLNTEKERREWLEQVAEPWYARVHAQAARDGLKVETYEGYDHMGMGGVSPAAVLLRPDGSPYANEIAVREPAMRADWGDLLLNARKRQELDAIQPVSSLA
jgi:hypothetical protein